MHVFLVAVLLLAWIKGATANNITFPQPRVNPTSGYAPLAVTVTLDQQELDNLDPDIRDSLSLTYSLDTDIEIVSCAETGTQVLVPNKFVTIILRRSTGFQVVSCVEGFGFSKITRLEIVVDEWEGTSLVIIIWTSILLPLSIVATIWTRSLLRKGTGPFKMWFTILSTMPLLTVPTAILFGIDLLASGNVIRGAIVLGCLVLGMALSVFLAINEYRFVKDKDQKGEWWYINHKRSIRSCMPAMVLGIPFYGMFYSRLFAWRLFDCKFSTDKNYNVAMRRLHSKTFFMSLLMDAPAVAIIVWMHLEEFFQYPQPVAMDPSLYILGAHLLIGWVRGIYGFVFAEGGSMVDDGRPAAVQAADAGVYGVRVGTDKAMVSATKRIMDEHSERDRIMFEARTTGANIPLPPRPPPIIEDNPKPFKNLKVKDMT